MNHTLRIPFAGLGRTPDELLADFHRRSLRRNVKSATLTEDALVIVFIAEPDQVAKRARYIFCDVARWPNNSSAAGKYEVATQQDEPQRKWADVGTEFITKAYAEDTRGRTLDMDRLRAQISKEIDGLKWVEPNGQFPFSPGMMLQELVKELKLRNVQKVAYSGYLELPDGPETGTYSIVGIVNGYKNGTLTLYYLDIGTGAVCLAIDEVLTEKES